MVPYIDLLLVYKKQSFFLLFECKVNEMYAKKSSFGTQKDAAFIKQACTQAKKAFAKDEVPIGAIVVSAEGKVIGRGYNQVESSHTQAAHAEFIAIAQAGQQLGDWRLEGCWIYVTLEPCVMCVSLIKLSRLAGLVYGPRSKLFGFHTIIDNEMPFSLYQKELVIVEGIGERESVELLKRFFESKRRTESGGKKEKRAIRSECHKKRTS
jgi:tRNA(adenine34) deaminase